MWFLVSPGYLRAAGSQGPRRTFTRGPLCPVIGRPISSSCWALCVRCRSRFLGPNFGSGARTIWRLMSTSRYSEGHLFGTLTLVAVCDHSTPPPPPAPRTPEKTFQTSERWERGVPSLSPVVLEASSPSHLRRGYHKMNLKLKPHTIIWDCHSRGRVNDKHLNRLVDRGGAGQSGGLPPPYPLADGEGWGWAHPLPYSFSF